MTFSAATAAEEPTTSELPPDRLRAAVRSDVGVVRASNEDAALVDVDHGLFMVADGVGGLAAGEVASAIAVDVASTTLREAHAHLAALAHLPDRIRREGIATVLGHAVRAAHLAIRRVASCEADKLGMSTTLDIALVVGNEVFVAHVGDTRTYLARDGRVTQITRDHTMAQLLIDAGQASAEDMHGSPLRHTLIHALGTRRDVVVDLTCVPVRAGDQLLLCSDGLHDYFSAEEIAQRLSWNDPELGIGELVAVARARGGRDNITGVLVDGLAPRNHAVEVHGVAAVTDLSECGMPEHAGDVTLRIPFDANRELS